MAVYVKEWCGMMPFWLLMLLFVGIAMLLCVFAELLLDIMCVVLEIAMSLIYAITKKALNVLCIVLCPFSEVRKEFDE